MSNLRDANDIDRMWQEAELYEAQGLYDHAKLVYQSILGEEPDNRRAQAKIVQIQFTQRLEDTTASRRSPDDLSPRLALDLGIAYMEMSLYEEALQEFGKALNTSPPTGTEASRLAANCLIHLRRYDEAQQVLDRLLLGSELEPAEKADVIGEAVGYYVDQGALAKARKLLSQAREEERGFIEDYDVIFQALSAKPSEDSSADMTPRVRGTTGATAGKAIAPPQVEVVEDAAEVTDTSIPLRTRVTYSLDNRTWMEGHCTRLAGDWARVQLAEPVQTGDSLILRIHLPLRSDDEQVWVVSRVTQPQASSHESDEASVQVNFVSFLPGGEATLKTFLEEIAQDASVRAQTDDRGAETVATQVFTELEERAVQAMQDVLLPEPPDETARIREGRRHEEEADRPRPRGKLAASAKQPPSIRFACQCGQVHLVLAKRVGHRGKCAQCGKEMIVPVVDTRPDSLADQLLGKTVGGCRLLYKIGGGGMGGVFKAHHLGLDIPVAVKMLHAHLATKDPVFVKRFIREARAAAKLQHPNVVGVMNVGVEGAIYYIIMPFLGGGSAAALLTKVGRLPVEKVLGIAIDIARALGMAEEHKMLHRDIKPANILFNEKGEAKLADLGLAKNYFDAHDPGITQTGIACGTPLYFSPEQAKGAKSLDIRSDIYSLGITLYHLLNGSPPFKGESAYVIFQKHVHEPLPPFEGTQPAPEAVFKLLQKMTAKDREDRFKNSQDLLVALLEVKQVVETASKPPPPKKGLLERLGIRRPK